LTQYFRNHEPPSIKNQNNMAEESECFQNNHSEFIEKLYGKLEAEKTQIMSINSSSLSRDPPWYLEIEQACSRHLT
jgi:hypothetical protein